MIIKFYGVRGSIASPGKDTIRYGGNTSCVYVKTDDDSLLIWSFSGVQNAEQLEVLLNEHLISVSGDSNWYGNAKILNDFLFSYNSSVP